MTVSSFSEGGSGSRGILERLQPRGPPVVTQDDRGRLGTPSRELDQTRGSTDPGERERRGVVGDPGIEGLARGGGGCAIFCDVKNKRRDRHGV